MVDVVTPVDTGAPAVKVLVESVAVPVVVAVAVVLIEVAVTVTLKQIWRVPLQLLAGASMTVELGVTLIPLAALLPLMEKACSEPLALEEPPKVLESTNGVSQSEMEVLLSRVTVTFCAVPAVAVVVALVPGVAGVGSLEVTRLMDVMGTL